MMKITGFVVIATVASLLQNGFAIDADTVDAAGSLSHHHKHHKGNNQKNIHHPKICKDRPGVHCRLIAEDGDCEKFTSNGESYGDAVCQVSCGRCGDVPDQISTDQTCYPFAKKVIDVTFSNSMPHHEDWVGIYPDTADPHDLGSPVAWFWLCGDKKHKCRTSVGAAVFPWLPPGTYKAVMSRNRDAKGPYANYGPYSSYAESRPFEVGRGNTCASRRRRVEGTEASSLRGAQP